MATTNVEEDLLQLEARYWQALTDGDVDTAMALTEFPCMLTGPQGAQLIDAAAFAQMMSSPSCDLERYELSDARVRLLTDDVAVLAYRVHEELVVDGKAVALDAADASTWIRRDGRWVCASHSESILGDPFGRSPTPGM